MPILCDLRINGQTVATVTIVNDGTGTRQRGNYEVLLAPGRTRNISVDAVVVPEKVARVEFYDRSLGAVELLRQALNALDDDE